MTSKSTTTTCSTKLIQRLNSLSTDASRESILTLSRWMIFNRKHAPSLSSALVSTISSETSKSSSSSSSLRQMLYLSIIHEVLVSDHPNNIPNYNRNENFRKALGGDDCLIACLKSICDNDRCDDESISRVKDWVEQWKDVRSFGDFTEEVISGVNSVLDDFALNITKFDRVDASAASLSLNEDEEDDHAAAIDYEDDMDRMDASLSPPVDVSMNIDSPEPATTTNNNEEANEVGINDEASFGSAGNDAMLSDATTSPTSESATSPTTTPKPNDASSSISINVQTAKTSIVKEIDFEKEMNQQPYRKVKVEEMLIPCKSIATAQIAREIRFEAVERLTNVLDSIPKQVEEYAKTKQQNLEAASSSNEKEQSTTEEEEVDLEGLPTLSHDILELDIREALDVVAQYKSTILTQRQARLNCIDLLLQSRCKFGSHEAAEAFEGIKERGKQLKKRRLMLQDAMELEGLDIEVTGADSEEEQQDNFGGDGCGLEPLDWYQKGDGDPS